MAHGSSPRDTRVLLDGFGMGESPRWHDGRLWFSSWGTNEIIALSLGGTSEIGTRRRRSGLGRGLAPGRADARHGAPADGGRA